MDSSVLRKILNEQAKGKEFKKSSKPKPFRIKPSDLGTPCMRKLFYSSNRVEEDNTMPLKNKRITILGTCIGEMLSEQFRNAGILIDYYDESGKAPLWFGKPNPEFPVPCPELSIKHAFIDHVLKIDGKVYLNEAKSTKDETYKELKEAKPENYLQGLTYLYVFNKLLRDGAFAHIKELEGVEKAEGFFVLYYNKNTSYAKDFFYEASDNDFAYIVNKIEHTKLATKNRTLPPKTPHYCSTCNWNKKCAEEVLGI